LVLSWSIRSNWHINKYNSANENGEILTSPCSSIFMIGK